MSEGALYVVTGVMAAGESTVAEALARRFERAVHVRGDEPSPRAALAYRAAGFTIL